MNIQASIHPSLEVRTEQALQTDCCCPARADHTQNMWRRASKSQESSERGCVSTCRSCENGIDCILSARKGKSGEGGQILMLPNAMQQHKRPGLSLHDNFNAFFSFEGIKLVGVQGRERNTSFSFSFIQRFRIFQERMRVQPHLTWPSTTGTGYHISPPWRS